jgi:crotonobetainyl-CoA:carnitine CoA-transferase CaiB-like acyl-CoA transferase
MRVLDLAGGPLQGVGRLLADLGATVLRAEPPGGAPDRRGGVVDAGVSLTFAVRNANKTSVVLDPSSPLPPALLASTDLLLHTPRYSPYDAAVFADGRRANPRLAVVTMSDFGGVGPMRDWLATPSVHLALSTVLSRSGLPDNPRPLLPPDFLAYEVATAQALWVCLLAYVQAWHTGVGDDVDFSVSDAIMQTLDPGMGIGGSARAGAPMRSLPRGRPDARHLYPIFPVRDGWVRICVLSARQWAGLFEWLGKPEEFADPRYASLGARFAAAATLYPVIGRLLAPLTRQQATDAGQSHGVPVAGLATPGEALDSPAFAASFQELALPDGRSAKVPSGWFEIDGVRTGIRSPAPEAAEPPAALTTSPRAEPPGPLAAVGTAPFAGLRVLDLGVIVVGGELGRLFADYGAEVIKIESTAFPDGSRQSWDGSEITEGFAWGHRNKRSLGLNLRDERGKAIFGELVAGSDVVLTNFKPGTLESLGFGWDELCAINPRIVLSESSAFGRTGPWSRRLGYGPLVRASTGLSSLWRYPELEDSFSDAITIFPDHLVARLNASAVAALLLRRDRTGRGGRVSTAQVDAIFGAMADLVASESLRPESVRAETIASGTLCAAAGDDEWLVVDAADAQTAQRLQAVTGADGLAAWSARRAPAEAARELQAAGVPAGHLVRVTDLEDDPHLVARGFFDRMHQPQFADAMPAMSSEARFTTLPRPPMRPAPLMAEHTVEIARDVLGLSPSAIAELLEAGVLEVHPSHHHR